MSQWHFLNLEKEPGWKDELIWDGPTECRTSLRLNCQNKFVDSMEHKKNFIVNRFTGKNMQWGSRSLLISDPHKVTRDFEKTWWSITVMREQLISLAALPDWWRMMNLPLEPSAVMLQRDPSIRNHESRASERKPQRQKICRLVEKWEWRESAFRDSTRNLHPSCFELNNDKAWKTQVELQKIFS